MPRVIAPLFSKTASGTVKNTLTFRTRNGRTICTRYSTPGKNNSTDQLAVQARTKTVAQAWPLLTTAQQASWLPLAKKENISPFNAFFITNWQQLQSNKPLIPTPTATTRHGKRTFAAHTFASNAFSTATLGGPK